MLKSKINIYTDGSLMRKKDNVYCGYGVYFPNNEYKPISRKFTHEPITNNRAELYAILKAIVLSNIINKRRTDAEEPNITHINIYSDSEYAVKTFNIWLPKWKKTNREYLNADIINEIEKHIEKSPFTVSLIHIKSHTGKDDIHSKANAIVDGLAKKGALKT